MVSFEDDFDNNIKYDPLAELNQEVSENKIHLRIQKRNARKCVCTIEGLTFDEDKLKEIMKNMKKSFACNGTIIDHDEFGKIIQLQGDIREKAKTMLVEKYNISGENIILHGYD